VSLVTFVVLQLPSIADVLYDNYISICDIIEWFGYDIGDADYSVGFAILSTASFFVGGIRDVALLLSAVVGFLASVVSLGLNIKGKNHIATALGAIALIISVMSLAILGASLVRFIIDFLLFCLRMVGALFMDFI
jgi:hypothetical protein